MSSEKMTGVELQAVRRLLFVEASLASRLIAGHTDPRTWQRYESGHANIPSAIDMAMYELLQKRDALVGEFEAKIMRLADGEKLTLNYYHVLDDYLADHSDSNELYWRLHQSAVSRVFAENGCVTLV